MQSFGRRFRAVVAQTDHTSGSIPSRQRLLSARILSAVAVHERTNPLAQ
jgi:hypothetical protein